MRSVQGNGERQIRFFVFLSICAFHINLVFSKSSERGCLKLIWNIYKHTSQYVKKKIKTKSENCLISIEMKQSHTKWCIIILQAYYSLLEQRKIKEYIVRNLKL